MSYTLQISEKLDKILNKLIKKNQKQLKIINKKTKQILKNPYHFKQLSGDQHGERRVHIDTHYVLTYEIDEDNKIIRLLDFDHHDKIYK
ncbi:type II toxin-antitoxin system mRNA interferase toxin, RelE/StbE family [Candidatus Woesearchaeota archaeon]|nr:type II toxin-antitoxin system mRNA interferase toxin, RelE/StbE family [Candidatus Woesearchaeota archaeon]